MRGKREGIVLVTLFVVLSLPTIALATHIPDTGQTKCYDDESVITCPQPGEPFYGQDAQYTRNPHSYTSLAGGIMVQDNVTGLVWENKTDDGSIHDRGDVYNWYGAQGFFTATLNLQNFGGYSDWRLPTVMELSFLVDRDMYDPSINTTYFPNTVSNYWSSTTYFRYKDYAWCVRFYDGLVNSSPKLDYHLYVRAVRGEQTSNNFIDNGDGTVTDTNTGLMWQQDTATGVYSWQEALSYCETLTLASHNDWRLPNVNELQSLVDYERDSSPTINTTYFPNTQSDFYGSSTTNASYPSGAWHIDFSSGSVNGYGESYGYDKSYGFYVRAVRAGQAAPWISTTTSTSITTSSSTYSSTSSSITTTSIYEGNCSEEAPFDCYGDGSMCCWLNIPICCGDGYCYANQDDCSEPITTTIVPTTTSINSTSTTTTTTQALCPIEEIYGEHSEQTELLRYLRDNVLNQTLEGQEIIRLYYELSPAIVKAMEQDEEFKEEVKEMIDMILELNQD